MEMTRFYALHDSEPVMKSYGAIEIGLKSLEDYNRKGFGIFWVLNEFEGARKKENLKKINFWFCDLDGGNKPEQMKRIKALLIPPSLMTETKNGYHCYFAVEGEATIENFERIQRGIAERLNGDKHCLDVLRLLRAPGYYHLKNPNEPFFVNFVPDNCSDRFYTEKQMLTYFSPVGDKRSRYKKPATADNSVFLDDSKWERIFKPQELYKGCRNSKLAQFTFWMRDEGLNRDEISYIINGLNQRLSSPLPQREVDTILRTKL